MLKTLTFTVMHFIIAFSVAYALTGSIAVGGLVAAVEPLAGVIFAYLDLFHSMYHLHATIIADFQRIVNTNSC